MSERLFTVYRIDTPDGVYVGATGNTLEYRLAHHASNPTGALRDTLKKHGPQALRLSAVWQSRSRFYAFEVEREYAGALARDGEAVLNWTTAFQRPLGVCGSPAGAVRRKAPRAERRPLPVRISLLAPYRRPRAPNRKPLRAQSAAAPLRPKREPIVTEAPFENPLPTKTGEDLFDLIDALGRDASAVVCEIGTVCAAYGYDGSQPLADWIRVEMAQRALAQAHSPASAFITD